MAKKVKKSIEMRVKKKRWVQIISPSFNDKVLGETHVTEIKAALGKTMKINLMSLIGDPKKQSVNMYFRITKQKGDTAVLADVEGYQLQQPVLRKLVRRGKTKIHDSFKCKTADKILIVVKPFVLTRAIVNNQVARKIRARIKQKIVNKIATATFEAIIRQVVDSKFQREMKSAVEKIYPLRLVEFATIKIYTGKKTNFEQPIIEKPDQKPDEDEADQKDEKAKKQE